MTHEATITYPDDPAPAAAEMRDLLARLVMLHVDYDAGTHEDREGELVLEAQELLRSRHLWEVFQ